LKYSLLLLCRYVVIHAMKSSGLKITHMCNGIRSKCNSLASCHKFVCLIWFAVRLDFKVYYWVSRRAIKAWNSTKFWY
jgi:hypothetical protein